MHPFIDAHQHDVHHPDTADAECERADEEQQHLQADCDTFDDRPELFAPACHEGPFVGRGEALALGNSRASLPDCIRLELRGDHFKQKHAAVTVAPEIARGGVRNPDTGVVIAEVVRHLDLLVHHADDGEAHAVDRDRLAHCRSPAEELLPDLVAEKGHPAALQDILERDPTPLGGHLVAHAAILRTDTADGGVVQPFPIGHGQPADRLQTRATHQGNLGADGIDVSLLETHWTARALAAGLLTGLPGPANDDAPAEGVKRV